MKEEKIILIVDDDETHRYMLKSILGRWGYGTCEAEDGESALLTIAKTDFSLVLMDVRMKGLSGLEVLSGINDRRPSLPVVLMTSAP